MDDWTLYDDSGPIRSGLTQEQAQQLIDANQAEGNTSVYAMDSHGERIPPA